MMKNILVIGGTRNMGHQLVLALLEAGHHVTVLNRGIGKDDLPADLPRLRADRTDPQQLRRALLGKSFDIVVDFVVYTERDAETIVDLLRGHIEQYILISSGQLYLIQQGLERPFKETDSGERLMPPPKPNTYAYEEWRYGHGKYLAERVFRQAWHEHQFPYTSLRLPMVNSERDPFKRLYAYIVRLKDGGPILAPVTPNFALRHIYSADVVRAILRLIGDASVRGRVYNISQEETVTLDEMLVLLGERLGVQPHLVRCRQSELDANGFLPDCSPFSERWMSELDNTRSKDELGMTYTPLADYLDALVTYYEATKPAMPVGYKRRAAEIEMAKTVGLDG